MSAPSRRLLLASLGLALIVVAVFWPALDGELVYDDLQVVGQNPALRSLQKLPEALTAAYWDFLDEESLARVGYWRPLTTIALFCAHQVGSGSPVAFHGLSIALHAAASVVVFLLARRLLRGDLAGWCCAAVFALHPLHVEPVAWISAVSDPLQGLLVLLALLAHLHWREAGSVGRPLLPAVCLALALLAKESALALVPLVLALDYGRPRPRGETQPWAAAYAPLLAVCGLYVAARVAVFGDWRAGFDRVSLDLGLPFARMLTLRAEFFGGALELLAWPARLNLFRELRLEVAATDPAVLRGTAWIVVWAAGLVWAHARRARPVTFALLAIPAALAPFLVRLEGVGRFPLSDRFLYLAVLGAALLVTLAAFRWLPRTGAAAATLVIAGLLGLRSSARIEVWENELSLFRHAAAESPQSLYPCWGLGRVLLEQYQRTGDPVTLFEALDKFVEAQDLGAPPDGSPRDPALLVTPHDMLQANLGIGWYYLLCADAFTNRCTYGEAELVFDAIVERFPDSDLARVGLGVTYLHLGRLDEAEEQLFLAVDRNPRLPQAWFHLGRLATRREQWEAAAGFYRKSLELEPNDVAALAGLGEARLDQGRLEAAATALRQAHALAPKDAFVLTELGALAGRQGRMPAALGWFDRALAIDPTLGNTHLLRAKALISTGDLDEAVRALEEACTWSPDNFDAYYNLGVILLQNGLAEQAADYLRHALELEPNHELAPRIREAMETAGIR